MGLSYLIADGVMVSDIASSLPKHATKKYETRDVSKIERIYIHHSGRLGRDGAEGAHNSARYCVESRDWPGAPYHFWVPWMPIEHDDNRILYQMQALNVRCYHTGGVCNTHGIGVCLQGNTSTDGMSHHQVECLEALIPYLAEECGLEYWDIGMHNEAKKFGGPKNKPSCPGKAATAWVKQYRFDASPDAVALNPGGAVRDLIYTEVPT